MQAQMFGGTQLSNESSTQLCKVCKSNRATHLCEDCGEVLCLECLETKSSEHIVCSNCHHGLGTPAPGQKFEKCPECGSRELSAGKRIEEICPRCHSTHTVSVEDKRKVLAQDLRHAIITLHYGYTRLRDFTNQLMSAKRLLVSLRMANFLHYRWLEEKIENIEMEIPAIKNRVTSQAEIVSRQMAAETKGLLDSSAWSADQFPFVGGVTNRVTHLVGQYRKNIDDAIEEARLTLVDIEQQLDGLDYYRKQFAGFYETAELSVNELPVCALPDIRIAGSDFVKNDKATGTLYITNKRLVFIAETGRLRKKTDIVFDIPLAYMKGIEEDGRLRKRTVLRMKQGDIKITCSDQTESVLPDYVEIARKFDKYMQSDLQRTRKLGQTDVSISDVRLKVEELAYSLMCSGGKADIGTQASAGYGLYDRQSASYYPFGNASDNGARTAPLQYHDRLGRDLGGLFGAGGMPSPVPDSAETMGLRRDAITIEDAARETVRLLRNGQLVPEDFIRRYKGLMRDSFETRKRLETASGNRQVFGR